MINGMVEIGFGLAALSATTAMGFLALNLVVRGIAERLKLAR